MNYGNPTTVSQKRLLIFFIFLGHPMQPRFVQAKRLKIHLSEAAIRAAGRRTENPFRGSRGYPRRSSESPASHCLQTGKTQINPKKSTMEAIAHFLSSWTVFCFLRRQPVWVCLGPSLEACNWCRVGMGHRLSMQVSDTSQGSHVPMQETMIVKLDRRDFSHGK